MGYLPIKDTYRTGFNQMSEHNGKPFTIVGYIDEVDGPLPEYLEGVPNEILAAVHTANHMLPWRDHHIDNWKA